MQRFEQYIGGGAFCMSADPNDFEANRELVRQMATYLATVNTLSQDPEARAYALRLSHTIAAYPCVLPAQQSQAPAPEAAPASQPGEPPFSQKAPVLDKVPAKDKETANELRARYETDAAKAAAAWQNAQTMQENLVARGMALNTETTKSVLRLQLFFNHAAEALKAHDWDEALSQLQAIESDTEKIIKVVGH